MPETSRSVLITGGAKRIGAAIAWAFARQNWRVFIHCHRSLQEAEGLIRKLLQLSPGHQLIQADLRITEERQRILPELRQKTGVLPDCLINNASTYHRGIIGTQTQEAVQEDYLVNFFAPFDLMQQFHQLNPDGQIINLLDQRICRTDPAAGIYALAKKSLRDATEACALAWAPRCRVNGVAPGLILPPGGDSPESRCKMNRLASRTPLGRPTPETKVADCCLFLADASEITGQILYADGGMHLSDSDFQEKQPTT